jgi:hypothetical protein
VQVLVLLQELHLFVVLRLRLLKRAVVSERPAEPRVRESGGTVCEKTGWCIRSPLWPPACAPARQRVAYRGWRGVKRMKNVSPRSLRPTPRLLTVTPTLSSPKRDGHAASARIPSACSAPPEFASREHAAVLVEAAQRQRLGVVEVGLGAESHSPQMQIFFGSCDQRALSVAPLQAHQRMREGRAVGARSGNLRKFAHTTAHLPSRTR